MQPLSAALCLTALALPLVPVHGGIVTPVETPRQQEGEAAAPSQPAVHPALRALAAAAGSTTLMKGTIEAIQPERTEGLADVFVFGPGGDGFGEMMGSPGFTGGVWVWRSATGETLMVSEARAPGFTIYRDGAMHLTRTLTRGGDGLRLDEVSKDLWTVANLEGLLGRMRKADFKTPEGAAPDAGRYRGEAAPAPKAPSSSPFDVEVMMGPRILRTESEIAVDPETKGVRAIVLDVVRNDPFGGIVLDAVEIDVRAGEEPPEGGEQPEIEVPGPGEWQDVEVGIGLEDFDVDTEGVTTRISLDAVKIEGALPARVAAALAEMRAIADELETR